MQTRSLNVTLTPVDASQIGDSNCYVTGYLHFLVQSRQDPSTSLSYALMPQEARELAARILVECERIADPPLSARVEPI